MSFNPNFPSPPSPPNPPNAPTPPPPLTPEKAKELVDNASQRITGIIAEVGKELSEVAKATETAEQVVAKATKDFGDALNQGFVAIETALTNSLRDLQTKGALAESGLREVLSNIITGLPGVGDALPDLNLKDEIQVNGKAIALNPESVYQAIKAHLEDPRRPPITIRLQGVGLAVPLLPLLGPPEQLRKLVLAFLRLPPNSNILKQNPIETAVWVTLIICLAVVAVALPISVGVGVGTGAVLVAFACALFIAAVQQRNIKALACPEFKVGVGAPSLPNVGTVGFGNCVILEIA